MNILKGEAVCGGIAIGTASVCRPSREKSQKKYAENTDAEQKKYKEAKNLTAYELDRFFRRARSKIGEKEAQIFSIQKMMVEDEYYNKSVLNIMEKQKTNAETAVLITSNKFEKLFSNMKDAYMRERADDIRDISDRIVSLLRGATEVFPSAVQENTVIFAENIIPQEALQADRDKIAAFVTEKGSSTSHTAGLARSFGIPVVAGIKISGSLDGKRVAIDGYTGTVYIEPDEKTLKKLREKKEALKDAKKSGAAITKSGKRIKLTASISAPEEVKTIGCCDGIGILRSENLYRMCDTFPSESYQFDAYRKVLEGAKEVAIRTLDINSDKKGTFFGVFGEENSAMGMRAIRLCLKYPQLFKIQLRAILRASVCGKAKILLPMIVSREEVIAAKKLLNEAKKELGKAGFDENIPVGAVIETPAAAVISDELAKECDFFLIDANNLTQYMLAMDRKNIALADLFDSHHRAVTGMIERTVQNAHKNGITAGICGDIAAESDKIPGLLKMGIDEISVSPRQLSAVKKAICDSE